MIHAISTSIHLSDTDASGRIFFGSLFRICEQSFESLLVSIGLPIEQWVNGPLPFLPIRRCGAEYTNPLSIGDQISVKIDSLEIGSSSVTLKYSVAKEKTGVVCATAEVVHVAVDNKTGQKTNVPEIFREKIKGLI
mgnify:CR=1 FL=1